MGYPIRVRIVDIAGEPVPAMGPGVVAATPTESLPYIGKLGWAYDHEGWTVRIIMDDGDTLYGDECWWDAVEDGATP